MGKMGQHRAESENTDSEGPSKDRWRKLEIPQFSGDEAYGWVNRLEWYFQIIGDFENERLQAVMVAMEGRAELVSMVGGQFFQALFQALLGRVDKCSDQKVATFNDTEPPSCWG